MKISIGSDHAGFEYKDFIVRFLKKEGHQISDKGTSTHESVDYADFAHPVAFDVEEQKSELGILVCGSGNGVCMTANKHKGIRAALCWNEELGALAKQHNDANILCLPARFISKQMAKRIVISFLLSKFEITIQIGRAHV